METTEQSARYIERSVSLPSLLALRAERLSRSLRLYVEEAWKVVEPSRTFVPNWHIDAICEHLEAVSNGQIRNLVINIPPRCSKSLLVAVLWPTWEWTRKPEIRQLFASYSADLSKRDSIKCRSIIESTWYQQLWGRKFQLSTDQNEKNLFGNTARGFRLATSVRGLGTGEGGDRIVCLPGGSRITTDRGDLEIGRIVDQRLPVRVLGPSGRWQKIEKYEKNSGRTLIEFSLSNGEAIQTTEEHLILTRENGWMMASEVMSSYVRIHLRGMRHGFRQSAISPGEDEGQFLLSRLPREVAAGVKQSPLEGRHAITELRSLLEAFLREAWQGAREILLSAMPRQLAAGEAPQGLQGVRGELYISRKNLFERMLQCSASRSNFWGSERSLQDREMGDSVRTWIHQKTSGSNSPQGWRSVRDLLRRFGPASSPHRRFEDGSSYYELGNTLRELSQEIAQQDWDRGEIHESVSIDSARRIEAPDFVYNVRVAPDHAYYTGGVVVHNCDDPHNVNEIVSTAKREAALDWWDNTMSTRLNDPMTACKIIVMQRVHEEDLSGHVLEQGGYEHLVIPMEYGRGPTVVDFGDGKGEQKVGITSIGIKDPRHEEGELLWPERIGDAENDEYKKRLTVNYDGQMNQNPIPREGLQFKVEGFRILPIAPDLKLKGLGRGWDKAGTEDGGAFSVGVKIGIAVDGTVIIYHVTRGQWAGAKREKKMREAAELDGPKCTVVIEQEPGSAGKDQAAVSVSHLVGYPVRVERVTGDKETRAQPLADQVEYGNVVLVAGAWNRDFIEECRKFPRGKYKDQVDAVTVAFNYLARNKPRAGIWGKKAH